MHAFEQSAREAMDIIEIIAATFTGGSKVDSGLFETSSEGDHHGLAQNNRQS